MLDILQFEFMRNALLAGILVSIACGIIGSYVVVNRTVFISGGIAHIGPLFLAAIRQSVYQRSLALSTRHLEILYAPLGDRAGVIGCAAMAGRATAAPPTTASCCARVRIATTPASLAAGRPLTTR